jgi:hypothetical protein
LLFSGNQNLVFDLTLSLFSFVELSLEVTIFRIFVFSLTLQIGFVGELAIEVSLESLSFNLKSGMIVLGSSELTVCSFKSFSCSSHLKLLGIGQFGEFCSSLLGLVQVIVDALDSCIVVLAFPLLDSNAISESVDLALILGLLLSHLCKLVLKVVSILPEAVGLISLGAGLSSKSNALLLSSTDLVSYSGNLRLHLVVAPVFLVEQESKVLNLFSECHTSDRVLVMSVVIVVILHQLFILEMSIFLLDGVELVSQSNVIFISLLDLKDLSLQLTNKEVLLVACKMHGIVILYKRLANSQFELTLDAI